MHNYFEEMTADVKEAIKNDYNLEEYRGRREELEEKLTDELFTDDYVTGNGSGSYYISNCKSHKAIFDDGMDYLRSAVDDFEISATEVGERFLSEDWEWMDVTVRCYLLPQVVASVLDEMEESGVFDEMEEE